MHAATGRRMEKQRSTKEDLGECDKQQSQRERSQKNRRAGYHTALQAKLG